MAEEMLGDHDPRNGTRGGKYSLFDGGTHIPLIVYWKGHIEPQVSDALVCQMDLFASLGDLIGGNVPEGLDSRNTLDAFLGKSDTGRKTLIHEAEGRLALRDGDYTMIPPYEGPERNNMKEDPSQMTDIADQEPERLEAMKKEFSEITGR